MIPHFLRQLSSIDLSDDQPKVTPSVEEENDSDEDLMTIFVQALKGTEGVKTVKLRGFLAGQEVFMLVDSGSTNCFISEELASRIQGKMALSNSVLVEFANGSLIECTHELPDQLWNIQGITFKNSFKIIPLGCYDVVLGMDWLENNSPMHIHWAEKWLQFEHQGKMVKVMGVQPQIVMGTPISNNQLDAMIKQDAILHFVQLSSITETGDEEKELPEEIQKLI